MAVQLLIATSWTKLKCRDTDSSLMHASMMLIHSSTIIGQSSKISVQIKHSQKCAKKSTLIGKEHLCT